MTIDKLGLHQPGLATGVKKPSALELTKSATATTPRSATGLVTSTVTSASAGPMPVDVERVAQIRSAVENGTYPLVPARIADAMIAARMLLTVPKNE